MGNKWKIFWTDIPLAILLLLFLNATCNFTPFDERTIHGYILFRRHHLRSINIPKFPNINRLSRSKSSRKDTDLAREGVVTCREHEKNRDPSLSLIILQKPRPFFDLPLYNHYRGTGDNSLGAQRLRHLRQGGEGSGIFPKGSQENGESHGQPFWRGGGERTCFYAQTVSPWNAIIHRWLTVYANQRGNRFPPRGETTGPRWCAFCSSRGRMFRRAKFRLLFFPSSSRIQLIELGKRARVEKTWNKRLCRRGGERGTRGRKIGKRGKRRNGEVEKLEWNKVEGDRGGEGEQKRTERECNTGSGQETSGNNNLQY